MLVYRGRTSIRRLHTGSVPGFEPGSELGSTLSAPLVFQNIGCFPLCQTDRSEISGNTRGKWNDNSRLNRANQWEWLLPCFIPYPNSLIRAKSRFVKNGTTSRGDPEYSGRKKLKQTFSFEFRPKFPESLAWWKEPIEPACSLPNCK